MLRSLVGSEMCIRDSTQGQRCRGVLQPVARGKLRRTTGGALLTWRSRRGQCGGTRCKGEAVCLENLGLYTSKSLGPGIRRVLATARWKETRAFRTRGKKRRGKTEEKWSTHSSLHKKKGRSERSSIGADQQIGNIWVLDPIGNTNQLGTRASTDAIMMPKRKGGKDEQGADEEGCAGRLDDV